MMACGEVQSTWKTGERINVSENSRHRSLPNKLETPVSGLCSRQPTRGHFELLETVMLYAEIGPSFRARS